MIGPKLSLSHKKLNPPLRQRVKQNSTHVSCGVLKNFRLLHSCQLIFKPDFSGIANVDTVKSKGFHYNSKNIQKQKHFFAGAIRKLEFSETVQAVVSQEVRRNGQPQNGTTRLLSKRYRRSAALPAASMSRFSSSGVSFGASTAIVSLAILPVNLKGTW